MTITSTASAPVPHSPHERRFFRLIPWGMAHTELMLWITGMAVTLAGQNGHPAVHSRLLEIKPSLYVSGLLAVLLAAGCHTCRRCRRMQPLLSPRMTTFCVAAFMLGLLSFLLYAGLTASYAPPDSAFSKLEIPSVYIHEFSGGALVFSLVLPLGLLSLAASLQASRNHVPGIKDILAVLWCLLVPFLCIFLLRSPEPEGKGYSAPFHEQKLPINKEASGFIRGLSPHQENTVSPPNGARTTSDARRQYP